jgi:hypothetical protein
MKEFSLFLNMIKPDLQSVPPFYQGYVQLVKDNDLFDNLEQSMLSTQQLVGKISEEKGAFSYAPGKWTIKELLCHMIDAERIFGYRALRFARNDQTPLSGFEENDYATEANADNRTVVGIAADMKRLRFATIDLFRSFSPEMFDRTGTANKTTLSVRNVGFIISGHETHHRKILAERYLVK